MFMMDVLNGSEEILNQIIKLNQLTVTVSASRIYVDDEAVAVVCTLRDITKLQKLEKRIRVELNKKGLVAKYHFDDMTAKDPDMVATINKAKRIGLDDNTVVIYGESGTGKEMIAQGIHNISRRQHEPFVAINCAAISENLLESELFGYEEGAFTGARKGGKPGLFELAHGGTIFLDEINSISKNLQVKLLRVIEEKEVMRLGSDYVIPLDVRIVSAANEDLRKMIEEGYFRSDLFYRLSLLELTIPPLRKRKGDIMSLFNRFLKDMDIQQKVPSLTANLETKLLDYDWPGNVRELRNIARRYAIFGEIDLVGTKASEPIIDDHLTLGNTLDLKELNRVVERKIIEMLSGQGMGKSEIADILGISRTALWKKLKEE
jgi:propionate catabolism operon transcriptional regulator